MRDSAFVFFLAAVLCVTGGMIWGLQMAASETHSMVGAHAHLNLVGWTTMAPFAVYYRLTPQAARSWRPRIHAMTATVGVARWCRGSPSPVPGDRRALQSPARFSSSSRC